MSDEQIRRLYEANVTAWQAIVHLLNWTDPEAINPAILQQLRAAKDELKASAEWQEAQS